MKKIFLIICLVSITLVHAQKKEKIKGSKIVTIEKKQVEPFESLEVLDNIEVFLIKGTQCALEIEADDNLHEAIDIVMNGSTLRLSTTKNITSSKKLSVRITYTDTFKEVVARNDSNINALSEIELNAIIFRAYDYGKLFVNAKTDSFIIELEDKSKAEINVKAKTTTVSLLKSSSLKALISSEELVCNMYQKTDAKIEGDCNNLKLRIYNNAEFIGKNFIVKNVELFTEEYAKATILAKSTISINASGKSEIALYDEPKIELKQFTDSSILYKKPSK